MVSEEALQIAEERREAKGNGEKERYTHLNAEFQKIASRALSEQWKWIEEKIEWDLFKKIGDIMEIFSCKDGHHKGQKQPGFNRNRRD